MRQNSTHPSATKAADYFLTRYQSPTLEQYDAILGVFFRWCEDEGIKPLDAHRIDLEQFRKWLCGPHGISVGSANSYLGIIRSFYKYAVIDEFLAKSPAEHLHLPNARRDESRLVRMRRNEISTLLRAAQSDGPCSYALVCLLAMLGLRISEACRVQIADYTHTENGHRVLKLVGKGNVAATIPLPPMIVMALDAASVGRDVGPVLLRPTCGRPMNRKAAARILERLRVAAGIEYHIHPHALRSAFVTMALDSGADLRAVQKAARHASADMTARYDRARLGHDHHPVYGLAAFISSAM